MTPKELKTIRPAHVSISMFWLTGFMNGIEFHGGDEPGLARIIYEHIKTLESEVERLTAALQAERERCARIVEAWPEVHDLRGWSPDEVIDNIARIIRENKP